MSRCAEFVVLGGGIAGLVVARELAGAGRSVLVLEQGATVGGLSRTFRRDGFAFDLGGHRFHSNNPDVVRWLEELMGGDLLRVDRRSRIRMQRRFVDYPVRLSQAATTFGPMTAARIAASYVGAAVTNHKQDARSFEEWVTRRFGRVLYDIYFKPYSEKLWGIRCEDLSADWAAQRISVPSLPRTIYHALVRTRRPPATLITNFLYPRRGYGTIADRMADDITAAGQVILTSTSVERLTFAGDEVVVEATDAAGRACTVRGDHVISTIPVDRLLGAVAHDPDIARIAAGSRLRYRGIILIFLAIDRPQVSEDSWTYFPDPALVFGRSHEPKNWSAAMVPDQARTSLALEVFSSPGEPAWQADDEALINRAVGELEDIGWVRRREVSGAWLLRVPYAYPIYGLDYAEGVGAVQAALRRWQRLSLVGRTGAFQYMNVDGIVEACFRLVQRLGTGCRGDVQPLSADTGRWI